MNKSLGAASLILGALLLSGCQRTECYAVEPDGDHEILRPCPAGWENGDKRSIREDEFKHLEVKDKRRSTR